MSFYFKDLKKIKKQKKDNTDFKFGSKYPILNERFVESGTMSGHYFHQDLLIARKIFNSNPERHVDIGSRTDGFVAHVAAFREIEIIDIRDQENKVKNIEFKQADLIELPEDMIDYCDSISALHSLEHFGLGRYGDPIDYYGHVKAIDNIYKILQKGGTFYFSGPIGKNRIEFNAHRVFSLKYLLGILKDRFKMVTFSYVDEKGDLHENIDLTEDGIETNYGCNYGCFIFELEKI